MDEHDWLAERFEEHRTHLRAVAYRMLGSISEADDAVQEAWLRLSRSDTSAIENMGGWLTTVVGRVCLNMLRARRTRREEPLEVHVPEPILSREDGIDPEHEALVADSVGLALLVVLESLKPRERLAFVLHDMFAVSFQEIAAIVDTTPDAARQLASRARRRLRAAPAPGSDLARQRVLVDAFLKATREGDFDALVSVLHPDVVFRQDVGDGRRAQAPIVGAEPVARTALGRGRRFAAGAKPAIVNGGAGVVVVARGRVIAVAGMTIVGDRIAEIDVL